MYLFHRHDVKCNLINVHATLQFCGIVSCCRRECERLVKDFPGARYKKFPTEKEAWNFVSGTTSSSTLTVRNC